jgi:hypothetical protein
MAQKIRSIGLGVLLLAAPLFIVACGGNGGGGGGGVGAAARGLWLVADSTIADNVADTLVAAPDNLYYNVHTTANPNGEIRGQLDGTGAVRFATLTGLQEVPAVITAAYGAGALSVDSVTNRVRGFVVTSGLTATAVHIHNGASGVPGPIVLPLTGGPNVWVVADNTFADNIVAILNVAPDNLYFNVHTAANPNGEIRGQLDASGAVRLATLSGAQETPAVTTSARGAGILVVDNVTNRIGGFLLTSGLTGTAAHVHNAARGVAGPIIVDSGNVEFIRPGPAAGGGPDLWVIPDGRLSPALVAIYNAAPDNLYFNVHTALNLNGEIRGQLDASGEVRLATLSGAQETPAVTTAAVGAGVVAVDGVTGRVGGFVTTSGLTGTAAHIHNGLRGASGPILVPLLAGP